MLNIAIVNDTAIAIEALRRAIQTNAGYNLLWVAHNGEQAIQLCKQQRPDLLLMDIHMPQMNGVAATKVIMREAPCPILIVTATISNNSSEVFEAMGHGALDVVRTPAYVTRDDAKAYESLLHKIRIIARLHCSPETAMVAPTVSPNSFTKDLKWTSPFPPLVVIGSSTGGPNALQTILRKLPAKFNAAIVIIQHIDQQFAEGLVNWLDGQSALPVALAKAGDRPTVGKVLVAGTNDHLILRPNLTFRYTSNPINEPNRPSVNVFFNSVAQNWPEKGTAILLTGMGRDGAIGLGALRQGGWQTIAQNKESCVVFGMPKAAIEAKAALKILTPEAIATELIRDFAPYS